MRKVRWKWIAVAGWSCTSGKRNARLSPSRGIIALPSFGPSPAPRPPIAVAYLPYSPENGVVRRVLDLPDQLRELLRPAQDDCLQVARHLPRQRQQQVRVLAQVRRQADDGRLRRRRHQPALDL